MTEEAFNQLQDELQRVRAQNADLQKQLTQALAGQVPEHEVADPGTIWIEPILSHRTKGGMVNLRWGNLSAQLEVGQAREHAHSILQAAEAAETDAFLYEYFTQTLGATTEMFGAMLRDFRALRERKQSE